MLAKIPPLPFWCFLFFAGFFCFTQAPVFGDPDTAWHIATGALWSAQGVVTQDPWSWTMDGANWLNYSWGYGVIIEWLYRHTTATILFPLTIFWYAGLVSAMCHLALKQGANAACVVIVLSVVLMIIYPGVLLRPNMITLAFAIISYFFLRDLERFSEWVSWVTIPLLTLLWINLHGGFVVLFLIFAVFGAEALIQRDWDRLAKLTVMGGICFVLTFANPFGYGIWDGVRIALQSQFNSEIKEWQPANFSENIFLLVLLGLFLIGSGFDDKRTRLADRIWVFVLFYYTVTSLRHSVMFALFAIPFASVALSRTAEVLPFSHWLLRLGERLNEILKQPEIRPAMFVACMVIGIAVASPYPRDAMLGSHADLPREKLSQDDLTYLQTHYAGKKLLNHYDLGGYLILWGQGNPKVFVDGRAGNLYPDALLMEYRDFMRFAGQDTRGKEVHKKYGFTHVILPKTLDLTSWFKNDVWEADYVGESVVVFRIKALKKKSF
jgi:hypothetical protein